MLVARGKLSLILTMVLAASMGFAMPSVDGAAIRIVAPSKFADTEADAFISPLPENYRVQYLYDAAEFASLPTGNNVMTQLSWRPDGDQAVPIAFTSDRMIMRLSTTSRSPADIDGTLDNNVTSEPVVVYDGPWNSTSQVTGPSGGPKAFDFTVDFQKPFVYDPGQGNVLVDFTIMGGSADFFGDFTVPLDVPARAIWSGPDPDSPTSTGDVWGGAVIEFTFVPEPAAFPIALLACTGLLVVSDRRSRGSMGAISWAFLPSPSDLRVNR